MALAEHNVEKESKRVGRALEYHSKFAEGKKYDQGKTRWDLVPWEVVEPLADILTFGAGKYGDNSWQRVENAVERYKAALFRHLVAWCKGEKKDPESGRSHLHHALTNIVFLIWFELHGEFQTSGFRDDEEYMTTEQKGVDKNYQEVNRLELGTELCDNFCGDCKYCRHAPYANRYHRCENGCNILYQNTTDGSLYCPHYSK